MKNNKGFTLIELLVTIALMLSLLGMAIVSFINVSDMRKEDAYRLVKEQIITAAKEYFNVNAYYNEVLSANSNNFITVSLGTLVDEDYLNVVTNPKTGKKLNYCYNVKVSMNDKGRLSYTFEDGETKCYTNSYVEVVEQPNKGSVPKITIEQIDGKLGNNNWYVLKKQSDRNSTLKYKITAFDEKSEMVDVINITDSEGKTTSMDTNTEDNGSITAIDDFSYANNSNDKTTCYSAENELGNTTKYCVTAKADYDEPTCIVKSSGIEDDPAISNADDVVKQYNYIQKSTDLFFNTTPKISLTYSDGFSGVNEKELKLYNTKDGSAKYENEIKFDNYTIHVPGSSNTKAYIGFVKDNAGNDSICYSRVKVTYKSKLEELLKNTSYVSCGKTSGENKTWTNKDVTITQYFNKKNLVGETEENESVTKKFTKTTPEGTSSISNVSDTKTCQVDVYVDKEKPYYTHTQFDWYGENFTIFMDTGVIRFKSRNASNVLVQDEYVNVTYDYNLKRYTGKVCIDGKKITTSDGREGKFNFYEYSSVANDDTSGILRLEKTWTLIDRKKKKVKGCYASKDKDNHPCIYEDHVYAYDKAGNKSEDIGSIRINVGYIGLDNFCK